MDEYVKREEVCNICNNQKEFCGKEKCPVYRAAKADVALVRRGTWLEPDEETSDWTCSNCGGTICVCVGGKDRTRRMSFCPLYGSRMDGGADNGE